MRFYLYCLCICLSCTLTQASQPTHPQYTIAGSIPTNTETNDRAAHELNVGWRFTKGDPKSAESIEFNDKDWEVVNLPHGLEIIPEEASGCANYTGPAWYRKTLDIPENKAEQAAKHHTLYFEGIMGKSQIFLNGEKIQDHVGGYLPIVIDVTDKLIHGQKNLIAVRTDNSDDSSFPPGKPQKNLDFSYLGGIYRDVYLIETAPLFITDANQANKVAGGGVFFWTKSIDNNKATIGVKVDIQNDQAQEEEANVEVQIAGITKSLSCKVKPQSSETVELELQLDNVDFWSPDSPNLYPLTVSVNSDKTCDAITIPVGIRVFKMDDAGITLNGKILEGKLIGGNRHQDFAALGNAVPNNLQWMDAVKLRAAGMRVIRCAHYPMDPAFMDACDKLGLFVIVTTPGWQFWGKDKFGEHVYGNIRQMVRRDRNHPSVFIWEPILNETHFPADFAKKAYDSVHEEYPYPSCYAACDNISEGQQHFDALYAHPITGDGRHSVDGGKGPRTRPYFCREFGDNVDSWSAHNSSSRVYRGWGETAMLIQAQHYLKPEYPYTSWDSVYKAPDYHFGAALWHPFDHQRGYHPDAFYGGIMDAFRQPKTSYYAFMAQRPVQSANPAGSGAMIHVAHAMTPFSPKTVTVFTNCDEVCLTSQGKAPFTQKVPREAKGLPSPPVHFENAWDFQLSKELTRDNKEDQDSILAEGLIGGKVVSSQLIKPSRRTHEIKLSLDTTTPLSANGSDIALIIAEIVDKDGTVKRLNNERIQFTVDGPASIIGGEHQGLNPRKISWGSAPVLVRMGTQPGKVTIKAQLVYPGEQKPLDGKLNLDIPAATSRQIFSETAPLSQATEKPASQGTTTVEVEDLKLQLQKAKKELNDLKNKEVEKDQATFEGTGKKQ